MMEKKPIIELVNISKSFPGVQALKDVSLSFYPGEIHALIGENGAGKTTLIKIMGSVYKKDSGQIYINGEECEIKDVIHAQRIGISVIHQELSLIPDLSVMENLCLGKEPRLGRSGFIDKSTMRKIARNIMKPLGLNINPDAYIRNLKTADRQMVEIARAVSRNATLVIMDEPTSSLSSREITTLFDTIRMLKKNNVSVIYVSHILSEVLTLADKITVMRDGCVVRTLDACDADENILVKSMVGREIKDYFSKKEKEIGDVILEVRNLTREPLFSDISFNLRKGEILGISGLVGAGRTEIVRSIFGSDKFESGEIILWGKKVNIQSPHKAIGLGLGFLPEDRKLEGLILEASVRHNISLPSIKSTARIGFVNNKWEIDICKEYTNKLKIHTPSNNTISKYLSGGNQQKIVVAKWFAAFSKILLLDEPTKGIDVNAKSEMYSLMNNYTKDGGSIIMVSSELPELLGIADRIVVIRQGKVSGILERKEATEEKIMMLASTLKNT
ncbi:MAG TPA: sugar ABC transporter ATP-binding protein [Anaerolineae bacterium]|nr:sugar ABC transporter ATP-binding protein [Anaerolineae bacterium]